MSKLTHVNNKGEANMVDVSTKGSTVRIAKASAKVLMQPETLQKIKDLIYHLIFLIIGCL
jgi:cyclic pyranopterin phosphate synthase